ncbi:MAG: hypothetical protein IJS81_10925 [Selenomonadaceae bacterium]|nr:hypothetical protein [Selenomonadaceae bacterium]
MKNQKNVNVATVAAKEGYEASVALRALDRAGHCPQLKGHVHELMFCDKYNANPMNIIQGNSASLTKATTAQMKDVVMTQNGRVVGHAQLKDTISSSGLRKTAEQIRSGHYSKTSVFGTEETAAKLAGKVPQKIHSSGISSNTTSRIANKALGRMPTMGALGAAARSGGMVGAAVGAGIETISSIGDVIDGKKDVGDAIIDVGGAAVKGGITGAGSSAAGVAAAGVAGTAVSSFVATGVGSAVAGTAIGAAAVAAAPVAIGFAAACAVGSFISSIFD